MLKFNLLEGLNKIMGLVITALLSRILSDDFGTYLYYQTIFGYLYAFSLFSSDYNFLVNYKISKAYIGSTPYYQTIFVKIILVVAVLLISAFFLLPRFTQFAFWPYLISVMASLFVYDFVLYIEDNKKQLILYRLLAQLATLTGVLLFYFRVLDNFYITIIQAVQTLILSFGTYFAARKYIPGHFNIGQLIAATRSITFKSISENLNYFLLRNFITFFTTIEAVILAQKGMTGERNIFTEGMRLSGVLAPFVLFYINFNINKIKEGYYTRITLIAMALLVVSPLYVLVFFGESFSPNIYYYNYFLWVFVFNAFIEKDYIELLTSDNARKRTLLIYNLCYFAGSVVLLSFLFQTGMPLLWIILLFSFKLLIYYLVLIRLVHLRLGYVGLISSFLALHVINYLLHIAGYYTWLFQQIAPLKHYFFKR